MPFDFFEVEIIFNQIIFYVICIFSLFFACVAYRKFKKLRNKVKRKQYIAMLIFRLANYYYLVHYIN